MNNEDWVQRNPQRFSEFLRRRQSSSHVPSQRTDGGGSSSAPLSPQLASPSTNSVASHMAPLPESGKLVLQNSAPAQINVPQPPKQPPEATPALRAVQEAAKRKSLPSQNRTPRQFRNTT